MRCESEDAYNEFWDSLGPLGGLEMQVEVGEAIIVHFHDYRENRDANISDD